MWLESINQVQKRKWETKSPWRFLQKSSNVSMLKTQATIFCRQCGAVWKYRVGQYLTSLNALLQWVGSFVLVTFVTFSLRYISSYEFRDNSLQAICHISPASRVFLLLIIISSVAVTIFQSLYLGACVLSRTGCLGSWDSYKPIWVQNNLIVSERVFTNRFGPVVVLDIHGCYG